MFDFVTFLSLFSKYCNPSSIFSSSFSPPKTSMDKGESCKHGWSVSDTSTVWSLGGSVICISGRAHSWYRVFLCACIFYCMLLWKIIAWISPDRRQRCLPLGRVYIYLCLVLGALPDTFSSSLEVSQTVTRTELGLQILSGQCSHALWGGAAGGGVRHAFLVLLSTKAMLPTVSGFWGRRASSLLVCPYATVLVLRGHSFMYCETSHSWWDLDFDFVFFTLSSQNFACFTA